MMPKIAQRTLFSTPGASGHRSRHDPVPRTSCCLILLACTTMACVTRSQRLCWSMPAEGTRRWVIAAGAAGLAASQGEFASAFPNAVVKLKRDLNSPKKPGMQPSDLGYGERKYGLTGLKECDNTVNCFSTTFVKEVDEGLHMLNPWSFSGKSKEQALQEVKEVVNAYQPGQQSIDSGGFQVLVDTDQGLYAQFESLRRGYIDDVELRLDPVSQNKLLVRSSSRQGYTDYGVNAIRLNAISEALRKKGGWDAPAITATTHPKYWKINCYEGEGSRAPFSVKENFPEFCVD